MQFIKDPPISPQMIVAIRTERKWTQSDLAGVLNVTRDAVASWEGNRKKPSGAAARLLELFDIQPHAMDRLLRNYHPRYYGRGKLKVVDVWCLARRRRR
jgi:transcriptional regulator with XRE-family HTH domain